MHYDLVLLECCARAEICHISNDFDRVLSYVMLATIAEAEPSMTFGDTHAYVII